MKNFIFLILISLIFWSCANSGVAETLGFSEPKDDPEVVQMRDAIYLHNQKEYKKSFRRFERYAKEGNVLAMYQVGVYYRDGLGVSKDMLRALFWFKTAGKYGHKNALRNVAYIYEYGLGVNKNIKKAMAYYYEAANLGSNEAAFELGSLYLSQNEFKDARYFLNIACASGIKESCEKLQSMKF
ncbi:MAG: sel1 repeat family protein [Campylobacter sp.]|nr:sel1 repeat family protein [Campylobacter sp.]